MVLKEIIVVPVQVKSAVVSSVIDTYFKAFLEICNLLLPLLLLLDPSGFLLFELLFSLLVILKGGIGG